ncbi:MAG: hypothetical protein LW630_05280 [Saprospiraceae bacterium]|nr:hypothetical protein [Saprospiraceae bacterium]
MNRQFSTILGFILFGLGILSIIFSMVGLRITLLGAIYELGVWSILLEILLLFAGFIILYMSRVNFSEGDEANPNS